MNLAVLREGNLVLRLPHGVEIIRGKVWFCDPETEKLTPLVSKFLHEQEGIDASLILKTLRGNPTETKYDRFLLAMGENPGGVTLIDWDEQDRLKQEAYDRAHRAHQNDPPRVHTCERCRTSITPGSEQWRTDRWKGASVQTPLCESCAGLLRIFAGGVGHPSEPMESERIDATPTDPEDYDE